MLLVKSEGGRRSIKVNAERGKEYGQLTGFSIAARNRCSSSWHDLVRQTILVVLVISIGFLFAQPATAGHWRYTCNNGSVVSSADGCKNRGGVKSQQYYPICGDGILDVGEQCDNGANNSDSAKNACRTDCRRAYCGDGTIDSGEQCDDGRSNSDTAANTCRENCRLPVCGDGVVDDDRHRGTNTAFNEACDDGNKDDSDGCMSTCRTCLQLGLAGNIDITSDTNLCPAQYLMDDYGDYGAIIIKATGVTLDCQGAVLVGEGRGVGVLNFRSNDVTIKNCTISGYDVGVRVQDARNVTLAGNHICDNRQRDVELIDATDVHGYTASMAIPAKCATAQVQRQSGNLAKITVMPPSESTEAQATSRTIAGPKISGKASPSSSSKSIIRKTATPRATTAVSVKKKASPAKPSQRYLLSQAARANWSSRSGKVVYGSDRLPEIGQARNISRGRLADGREATNLLLTQPELKNGGYIQGIFPAFKPGSTAEFKTTVAMLQGADPKDTLRFDVMVQHGSKTSVVKSKRLSGKQKFALNANLSRWKGQRIQLILRASHLKGKKALPAVWINPNIVY
jgi:parallel beta-helix repeat protein